MLVPEWVKHPPRFVPRREMPQIGPDDLTALMEWLAWRQVKVDQIALPSTAIRFHQRVSMKRIRTMPEWAYVSPILVSIEPWVIDGNHRAAAHKLRGEPVQCLRLSVPFAAAMSVIFEFAGTRTEG